jgi:hypothetical protein
MHSIESGEIRLTPRIAYEYEKPLVVLILIGTCGCRGQVIRLTTVDVFFLINEHQGFARNSGEFILSPGFEKTVRQTNGVRVPTDISVLLKYFLKIRHIFFDPTECIRNMQEYEETAMNSDNPEETMRQLQSALFRFHTGVPLGMYTFF